MLLSQASSSFSPQPGARSGVGRAGGKGSRDPLSVSEAMRLAQHALEDITVRLVGEVSEVNAKKGYKAVYFTIKDANAMLPCFMWNNRYQASGVQLAVGGEVELTGRFTLYAQKGRMNFDVFSVSLVGEGNLRLKVANLARKLQGEGLMDPSRKLPIPPYCETIGLVTSPNGKAVHDALRTLRRRWPLARVKLAGVFVEGAGASAGIIEALRACYRARCEVILLVRGGGTFEELMPFNDEALARAIAACPIPIVTGLGHEPDTLIADMVSDKRSSTPTGAAADITPDAFALQADLTALGVSLASAQNRTIEHARLRLDRLATRPLFSDAQALFASDLLTVDVMQDRLSRALPSKLERRAMQLDALEKRMAQALPANVRRDEAALALAQNRLGRALPAALAHDVLRLAALAERLNRALPGQVERHRTGLDSLDSRMARMLPKAFEHEANAVKMGERKLVDAGRTLAEPFGHEMALRAGRLHDLSPLAVLARGYSVAKDDAGGVVKSIQQTHPGQKLRVMVSDGTIACRVEDAEEGTPSITR